MSKVRRPIRKVDANQKEIVEALRKLGADVVSLAPLGRGMVDVLAGFRGCNYLLEIKGLRGKLTVQESEFFRTWRGQKALVRTPEQALSVLLGGDLPFTDLPTDRGY